MLEMGNQGCGPYSRLTTFSLVFICFLSFNLSINAEVLEANHCAELECEDGHQKITNTFSWGDYLVLGTMLAVSCGIGLFYGFVGKNQTSSSDFLLGGSSMGTFPMAMSLAASFVTAVELLGNPAEVYNHGTQFALICVTFIIIVPLTSRFYLPVFMTLRLTSSYEYLSLRFSPKTRYIASGLYILQMVLYTSVAVYAPALALSHVTGLNVYLAVTIVYIVCIFYASQGGMKAVIIADTFQVGVLIGSIVLILFLGEKFVGGTGVIWSTNYNTDRLELFNFNPNPTIRHSFWSVLVGGTFYWMTMFCSNQASIQKYMSVESIDQVRTALWTSCIGLILVYLINFYTGMIMVAHYIGCDPIQSKSIHATDEILPLYVLSQLGSYWGMTGFFVAGIFAASLGTVASALNSLAAVTIEDFICGAFKLKLSASRGAFWAKCISIGYGGISFALVFIVALLGSIMQVAISFNGMVGGITLGLFTLGMFFPWANSKGAIFGATIAATVITVLCIGQQVSIASGRFLEPNKFTSIEHCPCLNATVEETLSTISSTTPESEPVFFLYRISYIWYSALGFLITVIMGLIASFVSGSEDPQKVDADLLSPPIRDFLYSLSNRTKEFLNLPIKETSTCDLRNIPLKGIFNLGLDVSEETKGNGQIIMRDKVRKISAPSSFSFRIGPTANAL